MRYSKNMRNNPLTELGRFAKEIVDLSAEDFERRWSVPFLLVSEHEQDAASPFRTGGTDVSPARGGEGELTKARVFPISKSRRNTFQNMISVGRTSNNDIVIDHAKVSKLHAAFRPAPNGDGFTVTDLGSSFGTSIDGAPLMPQKAVAVTSGQTIVFGRAVVTTFFGPNGLYEHIKSLHFYKKL
jgi:hypothetical protein